MAEEMKQTGIKDFILPTNEDGKIQEKVNDKEYKRSTPVYSVETSSGIDTIIKRTLGKDVQYMCLILSTGQFYIKRKDEILQLNETRYKNFFNGLDKATSTLHLNGCQVFSTFSRSADFVRRFFEGLKSPSFIALAKGGLMTMAAWQSMTSYYGSTAWWGYDSTNQSRRYGNDDTAKEQLPKEVVKLVQYCVKAQVEEGGKSLEEAIYAVFHSDGKFSMDAVKAFIAIMYIYSPEQARLAIDEYAENDLVNGLDYDTMAKVFLTKKKQERSYYRDWDEACMWKAKEVEKCRNRIMNMDFKTFKEYLFNESQENGYADNLSGWCEEWADDLSIQKDVYGKIVEKYPEHLVIHHDKLAYRYRIYKKEYDEMKWNHAVQRFSKWEESDDQWVLLAPKSTDDILKEAQAMSNCVASYVQRVIDGTTNIMFLRRKENPEESVCTVELNMNGECIQFKARRNADPSPEMYAALKKLLNKGRKKRKEPEYVDKVFAYNPCRMA